MRLPNVENAEIPESKITKYLLSTTHRAGKSKASFFMQFGFDLDRWEALALALKQHASDNEVALEEKTIFGTRYIIDGLLSSRWKIVKYPRGLVYQYGWRRTEVRHGSSFEKEAFMIQELEDVILTCDLPEQGLARGDIGTVVLIHEKGKGYEVEFTTLDGETIAIVTLTAKQVRPSKPKEIAHARDLAANP